MWNKKIGALVLAAGYSSRMADFKSLLPFAGFTVIERVIHMFRQAGIRDIRVVVGHRAEELIPLLDSLGVQPIFNEHYDAGMFSSISKGVQSFQGQTEGIFLIPGDMPLVKSHTVRLLGRAFNREKADVIYPVFQKLRGHPPLISANCFSEIILGNGMGGLRQILEQYEGKAYELEVLDEGILLDLDTQEDYQKFNTENYSRGIPTQAECDVILAQLKVSEPIVNHGRVVADVSRKLALRLNQVGLSIDVNSVVAAGKLHDMAKGQPDHARVGGRMLKKYGYYKVAQIVASHTDILLKEERSPDEAAVVYLADKLVKGECIVSIEERFSGSLDKYTGNTEAVAAVIKRRLQAQKIEKNVEQLLGTSLKKVIADQSYL
jgi:molybdenum cofactor cytidylyltransferase